jgi:hypothetical protein
VPKTGGSFIKKILRGTLPAEWLLRGITDDRDPHPGVADIPTDAMGPTDGRIRAQPLDWYVSWYHYLVQVHPERRIGSPKFASAFAEGRNDFATTVQCV